MTREKMLEECVTPNEEVIAMCDARYWQGKKEGRKEAILYVRKLIKMFWKDWNKTSHKKLPYLAFEELDEHILEQADESNGRVFMQWYKEQNS